MSDEQPAGWTGPADPAAVPVPPGWAPQQPPAHPPQAGPGGWQQATGGSQQAAQGDWQQAAHSGWQQAPGGWGPGPGPFPPPPPPPPKPGIIALRPLGVGEVLDGAVSAIRGYPRIMLGLSAVVAVVTQLLTVPVTWLLLRGTAATTLRFDQNSTPAQDVSVAASSVTASGVQVVVTLVASLVLTGILTVAVSRAVLGQQISARDAWAQARPRIPALLGVTVLVLLIVAGIALAAAVPGLLLLLVGAPTAAIVVAFVLAVPVFLAATVYLYTAFALASPAIVLERQGVVASLRRSRALVRGAWWRTFGILLLVNVIAQLVGNILSIPFVVVTVVVAYLSGNGNGLNLFEVLPLVVTSLGTIAAATVTWPFTAVSTALLYVDRRMRREALDIELARAAGVAASGQPAPRR